ncbi:MAG: LLM class flavin-dependent oxidoreductase [Kouleothrix sp.]|nr:LLM class flavin-dependent oxidoreductase [Kouleothrix sp.]
MRFSLRLNNDLAVAEYVALARAAEQAGFDQIWVSNDLFLRSAPVILAAVAGATSRIQIGTCILNPYTIHPSEIAMLAATLDELSGCRFNLGLAAGAGDFLGWVGLAQARPLATVRETIRAIRAMLRGERGPLDGPLGRWSGEAYLRFTAPRVTPIYLGAMSPGMLRLAGQLADGALPLLFPPEHYFGVRPYIEEGLAARDLGLGTLDLAACVWVSLDEDRAAARAALAQKVAYYGHALSPLILERLGLARADFAPIEQALMVERDEPRAYGMVDERMLAIGVVGAADDVVARLEPLARAGADHLSFGPPLGPDPLAAIRLLGRAVLPHFRDAV